YGPLVARICSDSLHGPSKSSSSSSYRPPERLVKVSALTLTKFMCVSHTFCQAHLGLFLTLLASAETAAIRTNCIIGFGDMVLVHGLLMDQNLGRLFDALHDPAPTVRRNALLVIAYLVLNGLVKVKGQIGAIAKCLVDSDVRLSGLAKLFFSELAEKDANAIYNHLPDMISTLSAEEGTSSPLAAGGVLSEQQFRDIMDFVVVGFVRKEKQVESVIEKLCLRFRASTSPSTWRNLAYCLSLLPYQATTATTTSSERCIKKVIEFLPCYFDKLADDSVFGAFTDILAKAKKAQKPDLKPILDDYEQKLVALHQGQHLPLPLAEPTTLGSALSMDPNSNDQGRPLAHAIQALKNLSLMDDGANKENERTGSLDDLLSDDNDGTEASSGNNRPPPARRGMSKAGLVGVRPGKRGKDAASCVGSKAPPPAKQASHHRQLRSRRGGRGPDPLADLFSDTDGEGEEDRHP
ncbi:MAG: hypothetical protein ACREHV_13215, partial [Rhizomicrobium sp.]